MSIVQKKKDGKWYIVHIVNGKQIWTATGNTDRQFALDLEATIRQAKAAAKIRLILAQMSGDTQAAAASSASPTPAPAAPKKRLKISEVLAVAEKYRAIGTDIKRAWNRFASALPPTITCIDEISADIAFDYLQTNYGEQSGKAWNNNKTYLNSLLKVVLIESGLSSSPFERVIQRKNIGKHQRPFTEDEAAAIIGAAKEPWKSACIIAYHTGLRQKDCFSLKWSDISDGVITIIPAKTSRYNKAVQIPVHQQLAGWLDGLKRKDERVLGFVPLHSFKGRFTRYFRSLLDDLNIADNESGIVAFNSFRNTFITRCRAAKIAEHAIRGIAGHGDREMTDLYSHDLTAAKDILRLPSGKF